MVIIPFSVLERKIIFVFDLDTDTNIELNPSF